MKNVTAYASWSKQVRPGEIAVIGKSIDKAINEAFKELGLNIDVTCRGDLDSYGVHFTFTEKKPALENKKTSEHNFSNNKVNSQSSWLKKDRKKEEDR